MKLALRLLIFIFILAGIFFACSEDKNPLPSVSHSEDWNTVGAENFHGAKVLDIGYNSCKGCHGADLSGGQCGVSCYTSSCHTIYPHAAEWNLINSENFHGDYLDSNPTAIENCKSCHGADLAGGRSGVSCFNCHAEGSLP